MVTAEYFSKLGVRLRVVNLLLCKGSMLTGLCYGKNGADEDSSTPFVDGMGVCVAVLLLRTGI